MKIINYFNEENSKLNIIDYITIFVILLIYSLISFCNLGSFTSIDTYYYPKKGNIITIELKKFDDIIKMKAYNGYCNADYEISTSEDGVVYKYIGTINGNGAFSWNDERILSKGKFIKIFFLDDSSLGEIAFYNNKKELIKIDNITYLDKNISELTDESSNIPNKISYMNSSYFDEVYFARTAFEYANGFKTYEWTHPPLGKLIQAIPIFITHKMSPFNYRLMGNISGILMILVMYLFGKELFKKRGYAIFSSLLLMFDTFHFTQTRIGTVDSHLVLFIMLSILFMIKFINKDKIFYLFLSGLFFGLSICVKWIGFYSGVGLALLYFINLFRKHKFNFRIIFFGFLFFIFVPLTIYISLYLIFPNNLKYTNNLKSIVDEQIEMYNYHSKLNEEHFFSSKWYTWPVSYKPIWYHTTDTNDNYRETISAIGNIAIWWVGIVSFIYLIIKFILKRDFNCLLLGIAILSLYLPYVFIDRIMFIYHYFSVTPFMMLGIVLFFKDLIEAFKLKYLIPIYMVFVISFFIIYYPVSSGMRVSSSYIDKLKLFSSWYF